MSLRVPRAQFNRAALHVDFRGPDDAGLQAGAPARAIPAGDVSSIVQKPSGGAGGITGSSPSRFIRLLDLSSPANRAEGYLWVHLLFK